MESTPSATPDTKSNLYGLDRAGLTEFIRRFDAPDYHAGQIYRWLYRRRRYSPAEWTDLPQRLREEIGQLCFVEPGRILEQASANDGTVKYLVGVGSEQRIEAVFMRQSNRVTLCVSSQVGCALNCDFCLTGKMGFRRHLSPGEIVGQVARIQQEKQLTDRPFHIVFMGMGEPLHNYDSVLSAFRLLTDPEGFGLSRRRITVSTVGLVPAIERLSREPRRPRLAVSLNATTDEVRNRLMPVNRRYPIASLIEACRHFGERTGDAFTFEYVLLAGVNDTADDERRLRKLVHGLPCKVNLIPFNAVSGWLDYAPPPRRRVFAFRDALLRSGVPTSIRWSRGAEARAACGQLALLPDEPATGKSSTASTPAT
jgi:23S rRNA (adenine2503-C2)-methyltransferase